MSDVDSFEHISIQCQGCLEREKEMCELRAKLKTLKKQINEMKEDDLNLSKNGNRCRNPSQMFDEAGEILVDTPKVVLGWGAFGEVLLGTFENDQCAVKRQRVQNDRRIRDIKQEIRTIRSKCNHRNIIRYFCSQKYDIDDTMFVDIAMERCDTDLKRYISDPSVERSWSDNLDLLAQCVCGIEYLHSLKPVIIHRDIKPANILISFNQNETPRIVITDFGLSREVEAGDNAELSTKIGGTFGWTAPELLRDGPDVTYGPKIDIFALGCLFYYVLTSGRHPFHNHQTEFPESINLKIMNSDLTRDFDSQLSHPEAAQLIRFMIHHDPDTRIDIGCVRKHPLFYKTVDNLEYLKKIFEKFESKNFSEHIRQILNWHFDEIDWRCNMTPEVRENFKRTKAGKTYDIYNPTVLDLIKAIRNKYVHFNEAQNELDDFGTSLDTFWDYFRSRFPSLVPLLYQIISLDHDKDVDYFSANYGNLKNAEIIARNFWMSKPISQNITETKTIKLHPNGNVGQVSWKPKSNQLFSASDDKQLGFSTLTKNFENFVVISEKVPDVVSCFDWSESRNQIVIGFRDGSAKIFGNSGEYISSCNGHRDYIYSIRWSPSSRYIAAGSRDHTVMIWDKKTGKDVKIENEDWGWNRNIQWQSDSTFFGSSGKKLLFYVSIKPDLSDSEYRNIYVCPTILPDGHENNQTEWNKKTGFYATGSRKGLIRIWTQSAFQNPYISDRGLLSGHNSKVTNLVWCGNTSLEINPKFLHYLASASDDQTIKIWNAESGLLHQTFTAHTDEIISIEFCRTGKFLASAGADKSVYVWKVEKSSDENPLVHEYHSSVGLLSINWNNGGDRIAVGGNGGLLTILDLAGSTSIHY